MLTLGFKCKVKKGWFPYLFNLEQNAGYVGPIPDLRFFDASGCKTQKEFDSLRRWHACNVAVELIGKRRGVQVVYDLEKEKDSYCRDDVRMLAFIMESHEASMMQLHGLTPWVS